MSSRVVDVYGIAVADCLECGRFLSVSVPRETVTGVYRYIGSCDCQVRHESDEYDYEDKEGESDED